jgi:hypothetical protein
MAATIKAPRSIAWKSAVRLVHLTKSACARFDAERVSPISQAHERGEAPFDQVELIEREAEDFAEAHAEAVNALTLVPAPSMAALHFKIRTAHADRLFDGTDTSNSAIDAIIADVRRLAGRQ